MIWLPASYHCSLDNPHAGALSTMKAIDLYSGVGGWSLGMQMAGIEVVASYEWWSPANQTNQTNNEHKTNQVDIRTLNLAELPQDIQIVVGSPPCTQFSFANRGGQGDLEDGLKDIYKFFEVVAHIKPKYWAMENVPRVADILETEFEKGGRLHRFARLFKRDMRIEVVNMEDFGIPQRRARCIAGNFDFDLLKSYREYCPVRTLGEVIQALASPRPKDPIYGRRPLTQGLVDHALETPLQQEEERMNREAKTHHPVYNNMPFPDPLDRPVRTITALCTRVSRESVVVADERKQGNFRRLSVRERASLQTFPIDFQFYGASHQAKLKLIGNAVPPLMTFFIAQAMREVQPSDLKKPEEAAKVFQGPTLPPPVTMPDTRGSNYSPDRRFRSAIPGLRFKSGMRFELANSFSNREVAWSVSFYFGSSKSIQELALDARVLQVLRRASEFEAVRKAVESRLATLRHRMQKLDPNSVQQVWTRARVDGVHPFEVVDDIRDAAADVVAMLEPLGPLHSVLEMLLDPGRGGNVLGWKKLLLNTNAVIAGALVGATTNDSLGYTRVRKAA